jgi:radical SAM protein with 4Fe4S-binding SPASM domain
MSFEEVTAAIDNVKDALSGWAVDQQVRVSPSLHITGGEPLVRKDLFDVVSYGRECGFGVSIMSNGTMIDAEAARRIADRGVSDVQISIDGLEDTHEAVRGPGSFRRALVGVKSLVAAGVETNLNVTVSNLNAGQVAGLARLGRDLGASAVAFSRLVPTGTGAGLESALLGREGVAALYEEISEVGDGGGIAVTSRDPLAVVAAMDDDVPEVDIPVGGCAAGMFGVTIASDGTIMPCRRMDMPIGNILECSFRELWVESPVLSALRTRDAYHGGCETCAYWVVCRGCRAIALARARAGGADDCLGPDPQCPYWRPVGGAD